MKEMSYNELEKYVANNKNKADRSILRNRADTPNVRRRLRSKDEIEALDKLCISRWRQAEESGKVKYLSEREWYYEPMD